MAALTQLQKRVKRLEYAFAPKPPSDIVMVVSFGPDEEPHGRYGHRKVHVFTGELEPVDEQDEIEILRDYYEMHVPSHFKKTDSVYLTFEVFLKSQECKCGRQHPYANPEYRFRNTWKP